jgi:hypothetical protein
MNILAVVPFTGSDKLVTMTEECMRQLFHCDMPEDVAVHVIAFNNKADRRLDVAKVIGEEASASKTGWCSLEEFVEDRNYGFGVGINRALDYWLLAEQRKCDFVLVLNNDLQFPNRDWLTQLLREVDGRFVLAPRTDITATEEACATNSEDLPPQRVRQVSAYCWLIPIEVIKAIDVRFGWPLFCPQFPNYGSDDATAAILRKLYGDTPFKVVHRSFVKHLKAQTANELRVKAGTKELLAELKKWKTFNKLK